MSTEVAVVETRLSILGMRCAGCVSAIEGALAAVEGVTFVSVNFADHSALVKGDVEATALKQAAKAAGFDADGYKILCKPLLSGNAEIVPLW